MVAIGELGLSGELRRVRDVGVRLAEAGRMGFRSAVVPAQTSETAGSSRVLDGMRVVDVDNIARALTLLGIGDDARTTPADAPARADSPRRRRLRSSMRACLRRASGSAGRQVRVY